jgi:hypothetical protein
MPEPPDDAHRTATVVRNVFAWPWETYGAAWPDGKFLWRPMPVARPSATEKLLLEPDALATPNDGIV